MPVIVSGIGVKWSYGRLKKWAMCLTLFGIALSRCDAQVGPPPVILVQPADVCVQKGDTAVFTVVAVRALNYQWYHDGHGVGANSNICTIINVNHGFEGNYYVEVSNAGGTVTSSNATLTIGVPPEITSQPQDQTVAVGQSASFTVGVSNVTGVNYQWNFNGTPLDGATNATLTLTAVHSIDAGSYAVLVSASCSSIASQAASLTVTNPIINLLTAAGDAGMTSNGFTFQFSVPAGVAYVILASTDLATWTPISTNISTTGDAVLFTDTSALNCSQMFYRLMVP